MAFDRRHSVVSFLQHLSACSFGFGFAALVIFVAIGLLLRLAGTTAYSNPAVVSRLPSQRGLARRQLRASPPPPLRSELFP